MPIDKAKAVEEALTELRAACPGGYGDGLFVELLQDIVSGKTKSSLKAFLDDWLNPPRLNHALQATRDLLAPDYLEQCMTEDKQAPAWHRSQVFELMQTEAKKQAPSQITQIEALRLGARYTAELKVAYAYVPLVDAKNEKGFQLLAIQLRNSLCAKDNFTQANVKLYHQAVKALLEGDVTFSAQLSGAPQTAFLHLHQLLNNPEKLANRVGVPLYQASQEGEGNEALASFSLANVRDYLCQQLRYNVAEVRNAAVDKKWALPAKPKPPETPNKGAWANNSCEQVPVGEGNLAFRPMPAAIVQGTKSTPILIRGVMISGQLRLQQAKFLTTAQGTVQQAWQTLEPDHLSAIHIKNPYHNRVEQWSWDNKAQVLKRRYFSGTTVKVETLAAGKPPLAWQNKGSEEGFSPQVNPTMTDQASALFAAYVAENPEHLVTKRDQFPRVSHLRFDTASKSHDLTVVAMLLNNLADQLPTPPEDAASLSAALAEIDTAAAAQVRAWKGSGETVDSVRQKMIKAVMSGEKLQPFGEEGQQHKWSDASQAACGRLSDAIQAAPRVDIPGDEEQKKAVGATLLIAGAMPRVESLQQQLEDAINAVYREADSPQQALAVLRDVAMLKSAAGVIPANKQGLRSAARDLRAVFEPKNLEQKLANSVLRQVERIERHTAWRGALNPTDGGPGYAVLCDNNLGNRKVSEVVQTIVQTLMQRAQAYAKARVEKEDFTEKPVEKAEAYQRHYREALIILTTGEMQERWQQVKQLGAHALIYSGALPEELSLVTPTAFAGDPHPPLLDFLANEAQRPGMNEDVSKSAEKCTQGLQTVLAQQYRAMVISRCQDLNYAEVRDVCRTYLAHHVQANDPGTALHLLQEYAHTFAGGGDHRPFRHFTDWKLNTEYDEEMLPGTHPSERLGQPIVLHTKELAQIKGGNLNQQAAILKSALEDPNRVTFCDNLDYLQALYAAADQVYQHENLADFETAQSAAQKALAEAKDEDRRKGSQTALERLQKEKSGLELSLPKNPENYNDDDQSKFKQAQQQIMALAKSEGIPKTEQEAAREASLEVREKKTLSKEQLTEELSHLRALIVTRSVALEGTRGAWINEPEQGAAGWRAKLNLLTEAYQAQVRKNFINTFERAAKETPLGKLPPTSRWEYVANTAKGSGGLHTDRSSNQKYMLFNFYNPIAQTSWQTRMKVIPWRVTEGVIQSTKVYEKGLTTTATHPEAAKANLRLLQGKMEHLQIKVKPGEEHVALAHARAAFELGTFKSVNIVFDNQVPKALGEYFQKHYPATAQEKYNAEIHKRSAQADRLQKGLAELVADMRNDCDRSNPEPGAPRSENFQVLFNGREDGLSLTIPKDDTPSSSWSSGPSFGGG